VAMPFPKWQKKDARCAAHSLAPAQRYASFGLRLASSRKSLA
jgi:hypothetical protein